MIDRRWLPALLFAGLLALSLPHAVSAQLQTFQTSKMTIIAHGDRYPFTIEIAETPGQMEQGLMFRRSMAADAGMLFDYKRPTPAMMWMKNTLIPLDMLFVASDGRIVNIQERAVPESLDTIAAAGPVRAVIELNGGIVAKLGIKPGDRVLYPIFGTSP